MQLGSFDNDVFVLIIAFLLISGVIAAKFSSRIGLPSLVLFILVGMLIGSDGLGWIYFDNAEIAQMAGILALIIILLKVVFKQMEDRSICCPTFYLACNCWCPSYITDHRSSRSLYIRCLMV